MNRALACIVLVGCFNSASPDAQHDAAVADTSGDAFEALAISSIAPMKGSVTGGTLLTVRGRGFSNPMQVRIGDIACATISVSTPRELTCMTGASDFVEGTMDVVASDGAQQAALPNAFTYECPWTTSSGRRSCGAVPAALAEQQLAAAWVTQFQAAHGFDVTPADPTAVNLGDATDFVLGTQSVWFETDGAGTPRTLLNQSFAPMSFVEQDLKVWIKVDNVTNMTALEVSLGDATLANAFRFRLRSSQGQQWMTNGDWVAFAIPWAASNYTLIGSPDRAAISAVSVRAVDDATGKRVRVHLNGLAMVAQPATRFPNGAVSFTFDDNFATMVSAGAPKLAQHNFPATAFVIVDLVGKPNRASLADLENLDAAGWDISAHADRDANHAARFPTLASAVVEDDMVDTRAWLIANGFDGYNHCAYPGGAFTGSTDVLTLAGRYFTSCRTIYQRQQETYPPSDPRKLRVLYVTNDTPLSTVQRAIDEAKTSRAWLILVFHQLVAGTPTASTEWRATDFATVVDYVATSGIPVLPVTGVLQP